MSLPAEVDVAILGAGTAGMAAYRAAAALTDRVLLVEAERYGTTCARVGCMPSKLLIAAADAAHTASRAGPFGIDTTVAVDGRRVMDRVRAERDRFVGFVVDTAESFPAHHRALGHARFLDAHTLAIGDQVVRARATVIATGSRPRVLPMFEPVADRVIVNDDVFSWETLPESVVVFGPGVIGLELGQALHRLGVRVRMFGVGGLVGPLTDPAIREEARVILGGEVPLDPDSNVLGLRRVEAGVEVRWMDGGVERTETFAWLLATTGRTPNLDRLDLPNTGLALHRGAPTYDRTTMRCGDSPIFLAGDATVDLPLLHEAADEGRIAGANAVLASQGEPVVPGLRRSPLAVVFTDPNIAMIGETWDQVKDRDPVVGRVSFDDQGRSRVIRQNHGLLHVYADRGTGRLLGAEMIGPRAEHLAHLLAWSHQQELTVSRMLEMPFYHPVIEEGLRTALRDAHSQF